MRQPNRLPEPGSSPLLPLLFMASVAAAGALAGLVWLAAFLGARLGDQPAPAGGVDFWLDLVDGDVPWGATETTALVALLTVVTVVAVVVGRAVRAVFTGGTRVDSKARFMATAKDLALLTEQGAAADAVRLGAAHAGPGVPLGTSVARGEPLRAPWEWVQLYVMGPRAGKTTCVCVPQLMETGGPALATSNKRDIVDLTRGPRSMKGLVWVYDVQGLIGEPPTWWWNPLSYVTSVETADELTDLFITSATSADARQDAYFSSAGRSVLSAMVLAAAAGQRPITDVLTWLYDVTDETPLDLLSANGYGFTATALEGAMELTERQRDGVYGTARPWVDFLRNKTLLPWITRQGPDDARPQFDPHAFAASTDTIYLVSREGAGSGAAVTGALTMATLKAAEQLGALQPGGRLATPLLAVLDEAANVCRWRELPNLYSHYGSRGIILSTFLQSWAQGAAAWGEEGMQKLWSATNVSVVGPGNAQDTFVRGVSERIGDHDVRTRSVSYAARSGRSASSSIQRRRLFEVAEVMSLPAGRAIAFSTGMPAVLMKLDHYSTKPYADLVTESRNFYEAQAVAAGAHVPLPAASPFEEPPAPAPAPEPVEATAAARADAAPRASRAPGVDSARTLEATDLDAPLSGWAPVSIAPPPPQPPVAAAAAAGALRWKAAADAARAREHQAQHDDATEGRPP
ncbi:type IV secretory system conjugative DNA transfer family protein [uncultured Cellulomonas sp.]|uniref:type IV secretory system conjugative DNA transfer family protein n=1 Tax=uncultured Cellulomonas sp. TaxID=189682 RepID=UPI002637420A|nr:TraM recognition domain-containing protein [uncultured Cellulomonas sp.]